MLTSAFDRQKFALYKRLTLFFNESDSRKISLYIITLNFIGPIMKYNFIITLIKEVETFWVWKIFFISNGKVRYSSLQKFIRE